MKSVFFSIHITQYLKTLIIKKVSHTAYGSKQQKINLFIAHTSNRPDLSLLSIVTTTKKK